MWNKSGNIIHSIILYIHLSIIKIPLSYSVNHLYISYQMVVIINVPRIIYHHISRSKSLMYLIPRNMNHQCTYIMWIINRHYVILCEWAVYIIIHHIALCESWNMYHILLCESPIHIIHLSYCVNHQYTSYPICDSLLFIISYCVNHLLRHVLFRKSFVYITSYCVNHLCA